jgi:CheY-like chemotaxis protein
MGGRRIRVLVVDDHRDGANALGLLLREHGHVVRIAYSGREAVQMAPVFRPHAVILDLMMPGIDGFRVLALLQRQAWASGTVFIAYTGVSTPNLVAATYAAGFTHVLRKPVRFEAFDVLLSKVRVEYTEFLLERAAESVARSETFFESNRLERFLDDVQRMKERSREHLTVARASLRALDRAVGAVDSHYMHDAAAEGASHVD